MRIRRRPPFSSFPSFASPTTASPHALQDPSLYLPHHAPNGRDAIANNGGGGEREGNSGEHPPKDPLAQDPFYRSSPLRPPPLPRPTPPRPPPPCLDPYDVTTGCSIHSSSTHLTDVGLVKVQGFGKEEEVVAAAAAAAAKSEEERGTLLNAKMGWDDNAQLVNSNMRIDGISGASILLEAARQLEAATEKRKKGRGGCNAGADDDDCESDEKLKEKKKNVAKEGGRGSVDASSLRNKCTGIVGKDNDGYHNGDGPAALREEEEEKGGVAVNGSGRPNGKKRRSPAVLMEGSRCSRVNGRGWRCCQQTLVGYSLCEHHLGKGRLRSMSSVRGQIGATTRPKKKKSSKTPTDQGEEDKEKRAVQLQQQQQQKKNEASAVDGATTDMDNGIEEEGETSEDKSTKKKKTKMGTVKARSISSLLDEAELSAPPLPQQQAQSPITVDYEAMGRR